MRKILIIAGGLAGMALAACTNSAGQVDYTASVQAAQAALSGTELAISLIPDCPAPAGQAVCIAPTDRETINDTLAGISQSLASAKVLADDYQAGKGGDPAAIVQAINDVVTDIAKAKDSIDHIKQAASG